jgi:hypothetical protein
VLPIHILIHIHIQNLHQFSLRGTSMRNVIPTQKRSSLLASLTRPISIPAWVPIFITLTNMVSITILVIANRDIFAAWFHG